MMFHLGHYTVDKKKMLISKMIMDDASEAGMQYQE